MNKLDIVILILLIANLVTVAIGATAIGKKLNRCNKQTEDAGERILRYIDKLTRVIKNDITDLDGKLELKDIKKELKDHIRNEVWAMSFRGIKIQNLRTKEDAK